MARQAAAGAVELSGQPPPVCHLQVDCPGADSQGTATSQHWLSRSGAQPEGQHQASLLQQRSPMPLPTHGTLAPPHPTQWQAGSCPEKHFKGSCACTLAPVSQPCSLKACLQCPINSKITDSSYLKKNERQFWSKI